jgi:hypothetical protein
MGNIIRLHTAHNNKNEWLSMSNGGTSVFISVLVLSVYRITDTQGNLIKADKLVITH